MSGRFGLAIRISIAVGMLAGAIGLGVGAGHSGVLQVGAGDVSIVLERREEGLMLQIADRKCPPRCGLDLAWPPAPRNTGPKRLSLLG